MTLLFVTRTLEYELISLNRALNTTHIITGKFNNYKKCYRSFTTIYIQFILHYSIVYFTVSTVLRVILTNFKPYSKTSVFPRGEGGKVYQ